MLDKWLAAGRLAIKDMDLEDVAALKLCLMALGILIGLGIPLKKRSAAAVLSSEASFPLPMPSATMR